MSEETEHRGLQPTHVELIALAAANSGLAEFSSDQRRWSAAVAAVQGQLGNNQPDILRSIVVREYNGVFLSDQVEGVITFLRENGPLVASPSRPQTYLLGDEDRGSLQALITPELAGHEETLELLAREFKARLSPSSSGENKAAFYARIAHFDQEAREKIMEAYKDAKEAHRKSKPREGGERYFEHLRGVTLILIDECHIQDPDMIIAALLHDSVEDTIAFGSPEGKSNTQARAEAYAEIEKKYGTRVADIVLAVTKPRVDGIEITDESQVLPAYIDQLDKASADAKVVKLADVLHNSRTLHYRKPYKQIEVAHKNLEGYMPVLQPGSEEWAVYCDWMLTEIRDINLAYLNGLTQYLRPDQAPGRRVSEN